MPEIPRFAADRMLKRLARWLRLLGADVILDDRLDGAAILKLARAQGRAVLTRDKRLRTAPEVLYLGSNGFRDQLREVLNRYPFDFHHLAFTRCSRCNTVLRKVARDVVRRRVPPFVYASHEHMALCDGCGRVYWDATHARRAVCEMERLGIGARAGTVSARSSE